MGGLRIGVLGSLVVDRGDGAPAGLPSAKLRRLLTMLALDAGHVIAAHRLCDLLECSPGSLRTSVSRLRDRVGSEHLATTPPGYVLTASTDVAEFEHLVALATAAQGAAAVETFDAALALWRGQAIEEFRDESWAFAEVARLDELRAAAVESRAEAMLAAAMTDRAIADMRAHAAGLPLRERPRAILMRALVEQGRATEALRVYQDFRRHLAEETGTEPSEAMRTLEQSIAAPPGASDATAAPMAPMAFLFADIVRTDARRIDDAPAPRSADDPLHPSADDAVTAAVVANHGVEIDTGAGARAAAFDDANDAVAAAITIQRSLSGHGAEPGSAARVGIHFGAAVRRDDRWYGPTLDEAQRIASVGHAGQIVVSELIAALIDTRVTDLGEHRLRDVEGVRRLFQVTASGLPDRFPQLQSVGTYRTTLPAQRTTLIGREVLVAQVRQLVGEHRLVSLVGPGGVGKTRLAIEAAGQALGRFPGGVFFADLTRAVTPDEVPQVVLGSMRLPSRIDRTVAAAIAEFTDGRESLLVVDNCEHVVDRAAEAIDDLLMVVPEIRVLATSREPLRLHGERRLIVPSLDVDGPRSAGARLFADRSMAADEGRAPDSAVPPDDAELDSIDEIVRRLDGIPLAIELAAARSSSLGPAEILRLLDDRFAILANDLRRVPIRQQTLAATIDWSYDLLDPDLQWAFRRLSICSGPISFPTAATLLGRSDTRTAELLGALRGKSLLVPAHDGDESGSVRLLETLREYGRAKADLACESDEARVALERALLPPDDVLDDWTSLVNDYLCAAHPAAMVEDATRLAAATLAMEQGRFEHAALIFGSVAYRDDPGALRARAEVVGSLAARRDELTPTAWLAATAAQLLLERGARDYLAVLETAANVLGVLGHGHPARSWFELWQCALTTAVDPEGGLTAIDAALPDARRIAREPLDWTLSQFLGTKATGLALLGRIDDAVPLAAEAATWAPVGQESRDQILALQAWFAYLRGDVLPADVAADIAGQALDLGLAELCAAPGALHSGGSTEERAARLVAQATRRPKLDIATPYLVAFAWLAIEQGDLDRARVLLGHAEMYDASTQVAILYALAAIEGWTPDTWAQGRDAMAMRYLGPDQEQAARLGAAVLDDEIAAWEQRLTTSG